jgi:hypothetical protein
MQIVTVSLATPALSIQRDLLQRSLQRHRLRH